MMCDRSGKREMRRTSAWITHQSRAGLEEFVVVYVCNGRTFTLKLPFKISFIFTPADALEVELVVVAPRPLCKHERCT